jgi:tetratricopeptide (TPR) repeat protein
MTAMHFRKYSIVLAIFLFAVLVVQPALSADNLTAFLSGANVTNVTSDNLEKDVATGYYNTAERALVIGDFDNAIKLYDLALGSNITMLKKTDALLYLFRDKAYAQIQLQNYTNAVATVDLGLTVYPKDAMLWNNRGYALYRLGKSSDALASYDKAVSLDSNYTIAYINRGDTLSSMGRYAEAAEAYTRADETDPGNKAAAEGLTAARKGEAESAQTMTMVLVIIVIAAIGIVVWYIKFRKPAEPAPEEKKKRSKKK